MSDIKTDSRSNKIITKPKAILFLNVGKAVTQ